MSEWPMERPALRLAEMVADKEPQINHTEVLKIDNSTAAVVFEIDGVDYIATLQRVPKQRDRPKAA